jgi:hypothetical protein
MLHKKTPTKPPGNGTHLRVTMLQDTTGVGKVFYVRLRRKLAPSSRTSFPLPVSSPLQTWLASLLLVRVAT